MPTLRLPRVFTPDAGSTRFAMREPPRGYLKGARGGLVDPRPAGPSDEDDAPLPAAFDPVRTGTPNMAGLRTLAEPGTRAEPIPYVGPAYSPNVRTVSGSVFARHIEPTYHVALNTRLFRFFAPGWHRAPVPAGAPIAPPAGVKDQRMRPQPIWPGSATAWPDAVPSFRIFGDLFK